MANLMRAKATNWFVWIILGLVIVGLLGYGTARFRGSFSDVAAVGDEKVTIADYSRALNNQLQALSARTGQPVTVQQARALGVDRLVLDQVLAAAALSGEARRAGISISDAEILRRLQRTQAFQGPDGRFDPQTYEFVLQQAGFSPAEYEALVRRETAADIVATAARRGPTAARVWAETMMRYIRESRDVSWARVTLPAGFALPEPTDADLRAHYEAHKDRFMKPAQRRIAYSWITPAMLADEIEVSEEDLRAAYEARAAEFNTPERRLVERLVFPDQAAADAARARLDSGAASFEDLVAERGLELSDVDLGDVTREDLPASAADVVFGAAEPGVVGPALSRLGPALYRINGILAAQQVPFEEAREQLASEIRIERARRRIDALAEKANDLLAAGATLEELASELPLVFETLTYAQGDDTGPLAYDEFRTVADAARAGDFPELHRLEDGGLFALRLEAEEPARELTFEEAREAVAADWAASTRLEALQERAAELAGQIANGADPAALGLELQPVSGLMRGVPIEGAPADLTIEAFKAAEGEVITVAAEGEVYLARVDRIIPVDLEAPENAALLDRLAAQAGADLGETLVAGLARAIEEREGISIDQAALNAILAQSAGGR